MNRNPPPICLVTGTSGTGKTALVEKLITRLTAAGYKVATAKGHKAPIELDQPGKDTWRHRRAGAVATFLVSGGETTAFMNRDLASDPEQIARLCPEGVDLLLVEGWKTHEGRPKILITTTPPPEGDRDILCVVSDTLQFGGEYLLYKRNDIEQIAKLVIAKVLGK